MLLAVNDPSPVRGVGADHAVDLAPTNVVSARRRRPSAPTVMTLPNNPGTNSCNLDRRPLARRDSTSFCPAANPDDRGTDESSSLPWMSG
jgi:hypothetical protein